jgi:hypothetical protein
MGWTRDVCFAKNGGEILMFHIVLRVSSQAASTPFAICATILESMVAEATKARLFLGRQPSARLSSTPCRPTQAAYRYVSSLRSCRYGRIVFDDGSHNNPHIHRTRLRRHNTSTTPAGLDHYCLKGSNR